MQDITILDESLLDATEYTIARCQMLADGYLYNTHEGLTIFQILKSFAVEYQDIYKQITNNINGFYIVDETSVWLDELLLTYGLPNIIFPTLATAKDKALAINVMRYLRTLNSIESYKTFFQLLGIPIKFYPVNEVLSSSVAFDYTFPISFSRSTTLKDKITYFVTVEDSASDVEDLQNIGSAFQIEFGLVNNIFLQAQKILDFIKPDFIIFEYITNADLLNIL